MGLIIALRNQHSFLPLEASIFFLPTATAMIQLSVAKICYLAVVSRCYLMNVLLPRTVFIFLRITRPIDHYGCCCWNPVFRVVVKSQNLRVLFIEVTEDQRNFAVGMNDEVHLPLRNMTFFILAFQQILRTSR